MEYGFHRVIEPKGVIPQSAHKLDNTPALKTDYEILISVEALNLDSTSMRQIREQGNIEQQIFQIINKRGKITKTNTKRKWRSLYKKWRSTTTL